MPAQIVRPVLNKSASSPPLATAPVVRDSPPRQPSRGRPTSRPKKIDVKELEEKFKDLQQQRKKDESEQRDHTRNQRRVATQHQQALVRQQRQAERDVQRREQEVDKLEKGLSKVDKERRVKSAKESESVAKIDDALKRLEGRQQELEQQLEEKVRESALAKGKLSHIEFASTLLNQGQVTVSVSKYLEDGTGGNGSSGKMPGALIPASAALTPMEREQLLQQKVEELRVTNRRRTEDNARLRKQLDEIRQVSARQPKPLFACVGGELGGGTFYNLWDEGLDTSLGSAFSFSATIRYNEFRRGSKVFDFGGGESADNIYVGNRDETNSLVFAAYKGRNGSFLSINDFWIPGETNDYLFVVTTEGHMKVYRDGVLLGSRKGQTLRTIERRNLYVGRSNWQLDEPFEGLVSNIKVWSKGVEWSSTERPLKASTPAESWALEHTPSPGTATSCTYPGGTTVHFPEFTPTLSPLVIANQSHRQRILKEIQGGNHTQIAAHLFQSGGWDLQGNLAWRSGDVVEFITLVFQELSLVPPNESQLYPIYAKFAREWSNELPALECICLADAVLRAVFHAEAGAVNESVAAVEVTALPDLAALGGALPAPRGSPGRSSPTYVGSGYVSPELLATSSLATTSARSPVRTPVLTPGQRILSTSGVQVQSATANGIVPPPFAMAEVASKLDGRPNFPYASADWNRDSIPYVLNQASMQPGSVARSAARLPEAWEAVAAPSGLVGVF